MAQTFRSVHATFWTGKTGKQIRAAGPMCQVAALYAVTSPHANMIGLYHLPLAYIVADTGLSESEIEAAFSALERLGFLTYDAAEEWIWVREAVTYQVGKNDKRKAGARAIFAEASDTPLKAGFWERYHEWLALPEYHYEATPEPYGCGMDVAGGIETEIEKETEREKATPTPADAGWRARFDRFWDAYPKKAAKPDAEKAFKALKVTDALLEIILAAVALHRASRQWQDKEFIPHPATWLRKHRWDDEVQADPTLARKLGPSYRADDWFTACQHEPKCETGPMHRQRAEVEALKVGAA